MAVCAEARFTWAEHGRRRRIIPASSWPPDSGSISADEPTGSGSRGCAEVSSSQLSALMRRIGCEPLISPTPPTWSGLIHHSEMSMWEPAPARSSPMSRSRELAHYMVHHDVPNSPLTTSDGRLVGLLRREDAARVALEQTRGRHDDHEAAG